MPASVTLDLSRLDGKVARAFRLTVRELERALPDAHDEAVWGWDRQTRRSNGQVAGSPRDVVDTGALRDSQQPAQYAGGLTARITWNAEYAAATYLGAVFYDRAASLPARNVPLLVLTRLNPAARLNHFLAVAG